MTKNILGSTSSTQNMMANDEKSSVQMITENMAVNSNEVNVSNQNVDDDQGSKQDPEMSGVSKLDITKKKTAFQITSVRVKNMSEVDADSYSMDDLEESHTEDVSSDMLDYSRNTDVEPDAASVDTLHNFPINPSDSFNEHILRNDSVSRFRVVKLESKEPFRKGRWQCHDYLEPNVERSDSKVEQEGGSGNSSAASSVHYVPGVDDPAKNPITISKQLSDGQTLVEPQPVYPSQSINGQSDLQTSGGQVTNQSIQQHSQSTSHYQSNTQEVQSTNIVQPQPPNISQPSGPHDDIGLNQSAYDIGQSPANVSNNEYTNIDYTIQAPTPQADLSHSTEQQAQSVSVSKQNVHSTTTPPRQESTPPIQTQAQAPSNAQQSSDQEQRYDHVAKNGTSDLNVSQSQPESTAALDSSTSVPDSTTVAPATQPSVTLSTASVTDQVVDSNVGGAVSTSDVTEQGTVVPPRNSTTSPDDDVFTKETDPPTPAGVAGPREIKQEKAAKPVTVDTNIPTTQNTPSVLLSLGSSRGTAQTLLTPPLLEIVGGSSLDEKEGAEGGASTVAIDNKIEQAMDLVKSHLMFAVKEEVDVLREQIKELMEKNSQLEHENALLRSSATPETLTKLKQQANHPPTSTS